MDHLPIPIGAQRRPDVFFWARVKVYVPDDFVNIPKTYGYDDVEQLAEHGFSTKMDLTHAQTLLQEWLYFSLLSCVTGMRIDAAHFCDTQNHVVHTGNLNKILDEWKKRDLINSQESLPRRVGRYITATDALSIARRFITKHVALGALVADDGRPGYPQSNHSDARAEHEVYDHISSELTLSIAIMGEILQRERPEPPKLEGEDREEFWQDPQLETKRWGYSKYCRDLLRENHWCPTEILRLESTMSGVCEVYFASSIKRNQDQDKHRSCTWAVCKAPELEPMGHSKDCRGNCVDLGLKESEVDRVIQSGKTPLVTCNSSDGKLVIHEVDLSSKPPRPFGALSHTWQDMILNIGPDARGKSNNRRVYECQLKRMQHDLNNLITAKSQITEDFPFYVDALCYPRQVAVQASALNQMRLIYSQAKAVLVWDRALLDERKLSDLKAIEMNVKIRIGNWTKSLWTLLEAVLASNETIAVAFGDETITFNELNKTKKQAKHDLFHDYHHVYRAGHPFSGAIYQLQRLEASHMPQYVPQIVWNAVQFQTIDKVQNEAPILAALMKLDARHLPTDGRYHDGEPKRTSDSQQVASLRMTRLLDLMDQAPGLGIPSGLIFLPHPFLRDSKYPETEQYGWAPRTWLTRQAHPRSLLTPLRTIARRHPKGLIVRYPALSIIFETKIISKRFWVPVAHAMHKWYKIVIYPPQDKPESWWQEQMSREQEFIVILAEDNPRQQGANAVLVKPKGDLSNGEIQWVDSVCQVWVRLETDKVRINELSNDFRQERYRSGIGTRIGVRDWCVDGIVEMPYDGSF